MTFRLLFHPTALRSGGDEGWKHEMRFSGMSSGLNHKEKTGGITAGTSSSVTSEKRQHLNGVWPTIGQDTGSSHPMAAPHSRYRGGVDGGRGYVACMALSRGQSKSVLVAADCDQCVEMLHFLKKEITASFSLYFCFLFFSVIRSFSLRRFIHFQKVSLGAVPSPGFQRRYAEPE